MNNTSQPNWRQYKKPMIFSLLILSITILDHCTGLSKQLQGQNILIFFKKLAEQNMWIACLSYLLFTIAACVFLALPGATFAFLAGILFGPWLGILLCLLSTSIGASLAFLVGRYFLQESLKPKIFKIPLLQKLLFDEQNNNDIIVLMITRLVPLFPFNVQNFAYGITEMSFLRYSLFSTIFLLPGVSFLTIGFASLAEPEHRTLYLSVSAILFLLSLLASWWIKKRFLTKAHT